MIVKHMSRWNNSWFSVVDQIDSHVDYQQHPMPNANMSEMIRENILDPLMDAIQDEMDDVEIHEEIES